jgi:long-chain acyl-CoA synthetase
MRDALFARLARHVSGRADATALTSDGNSLTFADLASRVTSAAAGMRQAGIGAGDVVAVHQVDTVTAWVAMLALMHEGATVCALNPAGAASTPDFGPDWVLVDQRDASAMRRVFQHARILLSPEEPANGAADRAISPVVTPPDAVALLLLSSGTTGPAKLIPMTWKTLRARQAVRNTYFLLDGPVLSLMLPSAAGGLQTCLSALWHGVCIDLSNTTDGLIAAATNRRTRHIIGSPAQMAALLGRMTTRPEAPASLSGILLMGGAVSQVLTDAAERMFGCRVTLLYGTTELGACATQVCGRGGADAIMMDLLPGVEAEVVDEAGVRVVDGATGYVRFRSPCMPHAYWRDAGGSGQGFRDGWFDTGDAGSMTNRRIRISGRADDIVNFGGVKINPGEIDLRLENARLPGDAASFKFTGRNGTETLVIAAVAATDDAYAAAKAAIIAALGWTGCPVGFFRVAAIPRNAMGKPLRTELAAAMAAVLGGQPTETAIRQPAE